MICRRRAKIRRGTKERVVLHGDRVLDLSMGMVNQRVDVEVDGTLHQTLALGPRSHSSPHGCNLYHSSSRVMEDRRDLSCRVE